MQNSLERLNSNADRIDDIARRQLERRAREAHALKARCAPSTAVAVAGCELPPPLAVVGLPELACRILALVVHFVGSGSAGLEVGYWDLVYRYRASVSSVKRALGELQEAGWLVATPVYIPASETKLLGPYVSRAGTRHRSLRAEGGPDDPDVYDQSQARNLYTLGSKSIAAGLARGCGQLPVDQPEPPVEPATLSALISGSGSGSGSSNYPRACEVVDNPPVEASRFELPEAVPSASSTPLVADALERVLPVDVGDVGSHEGSDPESPRRGLFGAMGSRLSRFFRGGEQ